MTRASGRAILLGAAVFAGLAGSAGAAEDKAATPPPAQGRGGTATDSVGAGGLTGSAATQDGARTGSPAPSRPAGSSTPAAGTAR